MTEPTTQAGRALLYIHGEAMREPVLAIEAEAAAEERKRIVRNEIERQTLFPDDRAAEAVAPWREYVDHRPACRTFVGDYPGKPCDCGLAELLGDGK